MRRGDAKPPQRRTVDDDREPRTPGARGLCPRAFGAKRRTRLRAKAQLSLGCDSEGRRRRMKAVNAVTTSWPGLRVDRPTFSAVAESELDAVHRYLLFLTGNRTVAEDLTGETFEKAFRVWRRFDPRRGTPRAWLCGIARTTALDHFRSEERRRRREERYARDLPETGESAFASGELETALARLSAAEREVVALRVLLELDGPTVARVLGISTTACSTRLSRALKRLEEMMSDARD